ncbi:MAG: hypothetical protein HYS09_01540 [Chloroflexi bacterium]|nr:hypothetical protein [Chloroflexota bacterium]
MFTENGLMVDLGEVKKAVDSCDVFAVGFRLFPQRLLVDTRSNDEEGPLAAVVEPVGTVEERFFWLGQKRPRFGVPQQFTFFVWPHSLGFLEQCGVTELMGRRCRSPRWPEAGRQCDEAFAGLRRLEEQAVLDALSGRRYHTVWSQS